jgi:hypothetical protein
MYATTPDLVQIKTAAARRESLLAERAALADIVAAGWLEIDDPQPVCVTFLELVETVSEVANTEKEVVATVAHMLGSGSVELIGDLRH